MRLAITVGDPAGIGPEVAAAAMAQLPDGVEAVMLGVAGYPGVPDLIGAQQAWNNMEEAARLALAGEVDAIVTGPVSKHQLHRVGFSHPGQTQFFADRAQVSNFAMCLAGGRLTVALVTDHVPIREIVFTTSEIVRVGRLLADHLRQRGFARPRIAVAGFNPHAGEEGDLGSEEIEIIAPAVAELSGDSNAEFAGPFPADTLFFQAAVLNEWDGIVCMYHDQGLIPLKLHAFEEGVNITLGLPFIRTSPDHGTAFGIAGKEIASPKSMIAAVQMAVALARTKGSPGESQ